MLTSNVQLQILDIKNFVDFPRAPAHALNKGTKGLVLQLPISLCGWATSPKLYQKHAHIIKALWKNCLLDNFWRDHTYSFGGSAGRKAAIFFQNVSWIICTTSQCSRMYFKQDNAKMVIKGIILLIHYTYSTKQSNPYGQYIIIVTY